MAVHGCLACQLGSGLCGMASPGTTKGSELLGTFQPCLSNSQTTSGKTPAKTQMHAGTAMVPYASGTMAAQNARDVFLSPAGMDASTDALPLGALPSTGLGSHHDQHDPQDSAWGPGPCKVCGQPLSRKWRGRCFECGSSTHTWCLQDCQYAAPCARVFCVAHRACHRGHGPPPQPGRFDDVFGHKPICTCHQCTGSSYVTPKLNPQNRDLVREEGEGGADGQDHEGVNKTSRKRARRPRAGQQGTALHDGPPLHLLEAVTEPTAGSPSPSAQQRRQMKKESVDTPDEALREILHADVPFQFVRHPRARGDGDTTPAPRGLPTCVVLSSEDEADPPWTRTCDDDFTMTQVERQGLVVEQQRDCEARNIVKAVTPIICGYLGHTRCIIGLLLWTHAGLVSAIKRAEPN